MEKELQQIGLTEYESKIYLTLVKEGSLTGREISQRSSVPQGKAYEVLKSLISKGFVSEKEGTLKQFSAISPDVAVKRYCNQKINIIEDLQHNLVHDLSKIRKGEEIPSITERVSLIAGIDQLKAVATEIFEGSKKENKIMYTYEQLFHSVIRLIPQKISKGVKIKFLATKATSQGLGWMKEHIKMGVEVRYYPVEEIRINLKDDTEAMIMIVNPRNRNDRVGMHCKSKEMAKALSHYFDSLWEKAKVITPKTTLKELYGFGIEQDTR